MKLVTIVGARPQFVKGAAVSRAIKAFNEKSFSGQNRPKSRIFEKLVHTGQHYDHLMDRVFFEELELQTPDHHLGVGSGSHGKQTGTMLERIEPVLEKEKPDVVLVYGDTNSTLAGALAASKMKIPVAHVEAGLRSYDRNMPEELNRILTDHLSTLLFCPTDEAVENLEREGIKDRRMKRWVKNTGDVMHDSILFYSEIAERKSPILKELGFLPEGLGNAHSPCLIPKYYLATVHRAENTDDPERLRSILKALEEISTTCPVVLPLHPRTKKMMEVHGIRPKSSNIKLIGPVSYLDMLKLERNASTILTDSGGVQKEAYWLNVPCITLRKVTEWGYTAEEGWNIVAGWKTEDILQAVRIECIDKKRKRMGHYRRKTASEKIVRALLDYFEKSSRSTTVS